MKHQFKEKDVYVVFEIGLILKGIIALIETITGIAAYFVTQEFLLSIVNALTRGELAEDPRDFIANYLLREVQNFSVSTQHFLAFYLIGHGVVKLWLIIGLLQKKLWYYPAALIIFGGFVLYQLYLYSFTHSALMLAITILDVIVIALTWHEYRYIQKLRA